MTTMYEDIARIRRFLSDTGMNAFDLQRLAKKLCCCSTCKFYVAHYSKEGQPLDWGHCDRGNVQHSKKPNTASCGYWECEEKE